VEITISNKKQTQVFVAITLCLVFAHYLSVLSEIFLGNDIVLFDLGKEGNIPTMFSVLLLLYSSLLLAFIWHVKNQTKEEDRNYWLWLSLIFLYLSVDEFSSIHETIGNALEGVFNINGPLWFPWKIPFGLGLIVFVLSYLKFLTRLPKRTRNLFIISGTIFVLGAMGIETGEGFVKYAYKIPDFNYRAFEPLEESLEMIGVIIFIKAHIEYIVNELCLQKLQLSIET